MKVAVVGSGYVGLVSGACLADVGHCVTCVDTVRERVLAIQQGQTPFYEPGLSDLLTRVVQSGRLKASFDIGAAVRNAGVIFICVGTPSSEGRIDLRYVCQAAAQIGEAMRDTTHYQVVAVKSTVVPGTTDSVVRPLLERTSGKKAGDFGLCMNPEFLAEGSAIRDFQEPDRIIVGHFDERSRGPMEDLYAAYSCPKLHVRLREAEMIKYTSNALLATLISFSNEIAAVCERTPGVNVDVVMDGLHLDKRLSPLVGGQRVSPGILNFLRPGCGYGGSCLPKDVDALRAFAAEQSVATRVLDSVVAVNRDRPSQVVALAERVLGELRDKQIAVLGLAFKPGTDDLREAPALKLIDLLLAAGASVRAHDPVALPKARGVLPAVVSLHEDATELLRGVDAAILVTPWPEYANWAWSTLSRLMAKPLVLDARNAWRGLEKVDGVVRIGIGQWVVRTDVARRRGSFS